MKTKPKKKKNLGVSRMDSNRSHGWYVRLTVRPGLKSSKFFSDKIWGGKLRAREEAELYRDELLREKRAA